MISSIIKILLLVACVSKVDGAASSKHRLNTLEVRMNSIEMRVNTDNTMTRDALTSMEQDIETLNTSLISLECPKGGVEEHIQVQQVSDKSGVSRVSKYLITKGLADEKKWLREKVSYIENEMREKKNQVDDSLSKIESELNHYKAETDLKHAGHKSELESEFDGMKNDLVKDLHEKVKIVSDQMQELEGNISSVITEVKASLNGENAKRDEANNLQKLEIEKLKLQLQYIRDLVLCEDGWASFESFCYLFVEQRETYLSAREACRQLGASVADIQSQAENDFVYNLCENNGHEWGFIHLSIVWIGITDEITEDVWISDRTEAPVTYTNLRSDQPDGGSGQNCTVMGYKSPYGKWNDWECTNAYVFVCKK